MLVKTTGFLLLSLKHIFTTLRIKSRTLVHAKLCMLSKFSTTHLHPKPRNTVYRLCSNFLNQQHQHCLSLESMHPQHSGMKSMHPQHSGIESMHPQHAGMENMHPQHAGMENMHPPHAGLESMHPQHAGI